MTTFFPEKSHLEYIAACMSNTSHDITRLLCPFMLTSLFQQQLFASFHLVFVSAARASSVIISRFVIVQVGDQMAAMASTRMQHATLTTMSPTSVARAGSLSSSAVRFGPAGKSSGRVAVIRAAGDPERIDRFVEGAKSEASKNAESFGDQVAKKAGEVQNTVEDVGRDMGAKAQEAVDAGSRKVDQAGDKAKQVGDEVKGSTKDTIDSAKNTRNG